MNAIERLTLITHLPTAKFEENLQEVIDAQINEIENMKRINKIELELIKNKIDYKTYYTKEYNGFFFGFPNAKDIDKVTEIFEANELGNALCEDLDGLGNGGVLDAHISLEWKRQ